MTFNLASRLLAIHALLILAWPAALPAATLQTPALQLELSPDTGAYRITDTRANVQWTSNPFQPRFGQATLKINGKDQVFDLKACQIQQLPTSLQATFRPLPNQPDQTLTLTIAARDNALDFSYQAAPGLVVERLRLLDDALPTTAQDQGYLLVPVREGLLIPANSGLAFTHSFDTYAYEGCHMTMIGLVKNGAAALVTWDDCYPIAEIKSTVQKGPGSGVSGPGSAESSSPRPQTPDPRPSQSLTLSLVLRKSAKSFTLRLLGKGDYNTIAHAYRQIAKDKGYLVTWDQKLKEYPAGSKLFGAVNYKLWSALSRRMNEDSSKEESVTVNWTFDEAAQIAEHLKNDLKLDKVLFCMGGWIRRGYDNQHPDILPAAPECGGDAAFADASKRIMAQGYMLSLHDNYQDMYKDAPSWDESYLQRHPDGRIVRGGKWAGGYAYITCSQRAVELAKRPQNLPAVKKLTGADSYFIDTTYAAGLQECFDPKHPLTRADDMKHKQAISDYAREVFGNFGSECGREWAIPHADYFEGMTGVGGRYYHSLDPAKFGAAIVPLFELVYHDCIAMYGKYGYDINNSAEYVLHHITIARPMHHHNIPRHLYWKEAAPEPLAIQPAVAEARQTGPRRVAMSYRWTVEKAPAEDWGIFVHFTDSAGEIKFQGDYRPPTPTSQWPAGQLTHGPFTVNVPAGLDGTFDIRIGLHQPTARANLKGPKDRDRRCLIGKLKVSADKIEFLAPENTPSSTPAADPALFVRADNGWAAGMHPTDRFVKNTYEILSPLNELTARLPMSSHQFLTPDRSVRLTTFGQGPSAVHVLVNTGRSPYPHTSPTAGPVTLPPYGFLIESPTFVAFHAQSFAGLTYTSPPLFTLRSLDGKPIKESGRVRVYHAFGDDRIKLGATEHRVEKEAVITAK